MEMITQPMRRVSALMTTLNRLLHEQTDGLDISIYQPAGHLPEEAATARQQLKTHLQSVRQALSEEGLDPSTLNSVLKEAESLTENNDDFWQNQDGGLAIFIDRNDTKTLSVGKAFDNLVVVSCEYHLKPLMALAANVDAYYLLSLSPNEVKLLRGSALGIRELHVEGLPHSYEEVMSKKGYSPSSFAASGGESDLKTFFKEIDEAVRRFLGNSEWPLLIAGDEHYEPIYREVNQYPHLSKAYFPGNPDHYEIEDLHRKASAHLKSDFIESQKRVLIQLAWKELPENIQTSLPEILSSASQGRVEVLVVPEDIQCWGSYDASQDKMSLAEKPGLNSVDLYESAARITLDRGGEVFFLRENQIPHGADIMAQLRS